MKQPKVCPVEGQKKRILITHIQDYNLNLIEYPTPDQSDIIQDFLDPETYLTENFNEVLKHYEKYN